MGTYSIYTLYEKLQNVNHRYEQLSFRYDNVSDELQQLKIEMSKRDKESLDVSQTGQCRDADANGVRMLRYSDVLTSEVVHEAHAKAARGKSIDSDKFSQLMQVVNTNFPMLAGKVISIGAQLSARETIVLVMTFLRFEPKEISTLMSLNIQNITNVRRSLNQKLFQENTARTLDVNLETFRKENGIIQ